MSRVTKRFLRKMGKSLIMPTYVVGSMAAGGFAAHFLGYNPGNGVLIAGLVFVVMPMLGAIIKDLYQDAKREVEGEDAKVMQTLKGE